MRVSGCISCNMVCVLKNLCEAQVRQRGEAERGPVKRPNECFGAKEEVYAGEFIIKKSRLLVALFYYMALPCIRLIIFTLPSFIVQSKITKVDTS